MNYTYKELQNGSDIRGVALEGVDGEEINLTQQAVKDLAMAFSQWLQQKTGKEQVKIAIGRDSRLSGPALEQAVIDGLLLTGDTILECGLSTTPAMFMATQFPQSNCDGAIMLTASHLPWNRNGMKFFTKEGGLESKDILSLIQLADTLEESGKPFGSLSKFDLMDLYAIHLQNLIKEQVQADDYEHPLKNLHIIVDAGNGAGGFFATKVLGPLGANISGSQFLEPDGHFPNHIPNPENKEAMESICQAVKDHQADLGLIFDTDVDRSSAVDENGDPIARNSIIALAALIAAKKNPHTTIVTDSVTSDELHDFLEQKGMRHHRFKRGYKNVINEAIRLNQEGIDTQLAIETSGHAAFKENFFLDDGAYLAALIVSYALKNPLSKTLNDLKEPLESEEVRIKITNNDFKEYGENVIHEIHKKAEHAPYISFADSTFEGVRLNFDPEHGDGWLLVRMSLHDPILPCNLESRKQGGVETMKTWLKEALYGKTDLDLSVLEA